MAGRRSGSGRSRWGAGAEGLQGPDASAVLAAKDWLPGGCCWLGMGTRRLAAVLAAVHCCCACFCRLASIGLQATKQTKVRHARAMLLVCTWLQASHQLPYVPNAAHSSLPPAALPCPADAAAAAACSCSCRVPRVGQLQAGCAGGVQAGLDWGCEQVGRVQGSSAHDMMMCWQMPCTNELLVAVLALQCSIPAAVLACRQHSWLFSAPGELADMTRSHQQAAPTASATPMCQPCTCC